MFLLDLWELCGKPCRQLGETPIINMWGFLIQHVIVLVLWYFRTRESHFPVIADKWAVVMCNRQFPFGGKAGDWPCFCVLLLKESYVKNILNALLGMNSFNCNTYIYARKDPFCKRYQWSFAFRCW